MNKHGQNQKTAGAAPAGGQPPLVDGVETVAPSAAAGERPAIERGSLMDEYAAYVGNCRTRGVLPCSLDSFSATLRPDVRTWRDRIGKGPTFPLHAPNEVERAMVEEIAELREVAVSRPPAPKSMADGRQLIVVGGQAVSMGALLDLQRDAARYRWLRDKADDMACTAAPMVASLDESGRMVALIDGDDLDAAVDIAMARPAARRAPNKKLLGSN